MNELTFSMPIQKVDVEKRTITGFATSDVLDRQGDLVTVEATRKAFADFKRNLREMHQENAVGRVLSFKEQEVLDPQTNKTYTGMFVEAYVSKGSPNTWEKVLDGTLRAFSVGGSILKASFDKAESGDNIRVIDEYALTELSLVDVPANQLSNILSVQKSEGGATLIKGMVAEVDLTNIFYCEADELMAPSKEESKTCPQCNEAMKNSGWVEDNISVNSIADNLIKGGVNTTVETKTEKHEEITVEVPEQLPTPEEAIEKNAEAVSAEEADEAPEEVEDVDFAKMLDGLKDQLAKSNDETKDAVSSLKAEIEEAITKFQSETEDLRKLHVSLTEQFTATKESLDEMEKRLNKVSSTAVKKSASVTEAEVVTEPSDDEINKSMWGGRFLSLDNV